MCVFTHIGHISNVLYICYIQNRRLLDTLQVLRSSVGRGRILLYNTLAIGHTKHAGEQSVSSWPFPNTILRGLTVRASSSFPPLALHIGRLSRMDKVWFCKLLLLFEIDGGVKRHKCAFVSIMKVFTYDICYILFIHHT